LGIPPTTNNNIHDYYFLVN